MLQSNWERAAAEVPLVVIDTETTGLHPGLGDRVVEVAAVRFEGWRETGRFNRLVNPDRPMSAKASEISGISDADLVDQPPFNALLPELMPLLEGAVLVAHNAVFDAGFLGLELHLAGHLPAEARGPQLPNPWLCTLQLARRHFHFSRNNLGSVARRLGVRMGRAHRALNDVYTTANVLKRMTHELARQRLETIGDLLHAQGEPIFTPPPPAIDLPPAIAAALEQQKTVQVLYVGDAPRSEMIVQPRYAVRFRGVPQLIVHDPETGQQLALQLDLIFRADPL